MSYTLKGLSTIAVGDYEKTIRPELRSGDLFFASGNYLFSRGIRWLTRSKWSHVGIIIRIDEIDRILLLECVEFAGVRLAPLSRYLVNYTSGRPYNGEIYIAKRINPSSKADELINPADKKTLVEVGSDLLALRYNWKEIFQITALTIMMFGIGRTHFGRFKAKSTGEYICSGLVYECMKKINIDFLQGKNKEKGYVVPETIASDDRVDFRFRLL